MKTLTDDDLALTGGDFRLDPFRRIQVWVPTTTTVTSCAFDDPPPPSKPQKDTRTRRTVPCPECGCDKSLKAALCQRCAAVARSAKHGTDSGYQAHLRRKEPPCNPCSAAHLEVVKASNARRQTDPDRSPTCGCGATKTPASLRCHKCASKHRSNLNEQKDAA